MKEKPKLQDRTIVDRLRAGYEVEVAQVEFLPIGDVSSAKYRVVTRGTVPYFLKLRKAGFKEISVLIPHFLHEHGLYQVLSPLKTSDDRLWTSLDDYTCILYPFIEGQDGFQDQLSRDQWIELGAVLKRVHSVKLPPYLQKAIPRETFSPHLREKVKGYLIQAESNAYEDPVSAAMTADLQQHREEIKFIIRRAEELADSLHSQPPDHVLCHTDIHAGNLLIEASGAMHIIDWDDPMLAPKERDLMFIGGGIGGIWNTAREEENFYESYDTQGTNMTALTYYRYERIISDIMEFCQEILDTTDGDADRERSLQKYRSIFSPRQVWEIARRTDNLLRSG